MPKNSKRDADTHARTHARTHIYARVVACTSDPRGDSLSNETRRRGHRVNSTVAELNVWAESAAAIKRSAERERYRCDRIAGP